MLEKLVLLGYAISVYPAWVYASARLIIRQKQNYARAYARRDGWISSSHKGNSMFVGAILALIWPLTIIAILTALVTRKISESAMEGAVDKAVERLERPKPEKPTLGRLEEI